MEVVNCGLQASGYNTCLPRNCTVHLGKGTDGKETPSIDVIEAKAEHICAGRDSWE